jgi:hypothetical protein
LNPVFQASLEQCRGLFVMVQAFKDWFDHKGLNRKVPICSFPDCMPPLGGMKFDLDGYLSSNSKTVLFIGEYLRDFSAFFDLELPLGYRKLILNGDRIPTHVERNDSVEVLQHVSNDEYDHFIVTSIVFLHLFEAAANTTAIECLAFYTPIVVNRLAALEEYLGRDYPLFYDDR